MIRRAPLDPGVARVRVGARAVLREIAEGMSAAGSHADDDAPLVLVALSGGADSLALAAAVAFEAPRAGLRAGAVIIDHGLQHDSSRVAAHAAAQAERLGLAPVIIRRIVVRSEHPDGPEAAAREARYAELERVRVEVSGIALLTAHTRDDQAEQVMLALARGSGTRALAGIPPARGAIRRPLLAVSREDTVRACAAAGIVPWNDPHNTDPSFARVRVRQRVLPHLETELGPGISVNLARTAELAREDADALDAMSADLIADPLNPLCFDTPDTPGTPGTHEPSGGEISLGVEPLRAQPAAIRHRIIRMIARDRFDSHLTREHTLAIAALVTRWRGQGPIDAPGFTAHRSAERLVFTARRAH